MVSCLPNALKHVQTLGRQWGARLIRPYHQQVCSPMEAMVDNAEREAESARELRAVGLGCRRGNESVDPYSTLISATPILNHHLTSLLQDHEITRKQGSNDQLLC